MKIQIDIKALSTRHSFTGEDLKYFLEVELLGHILRIPVTGELVQNIDDYIDKSMNRAVEETQGYREERREYPETYDTGVDYDLGSVSLNDMEDL